MKKKQLKSEIKLTGGKLNGWYIHVSDNHGYKEDFVLTTKELVMLKKLIDKKIKK